MIEVRVLIHYKHGPLYGFFISHVTLYRISQKLIGIVGVGPNTVIGCWYLSVLQIESGDIDLWQIRENLSKNYCIPFSLARFWESKSEMKSSQGKVESEWRSTATGAT
jgi:hypothetical protein